MMNVSAMDVLTTLATLAAAFGIVRYQTGENKKDIESIRVKMEAQAETIVELRTKQEASITAKEVSEHYLSKEHFRQFEKHIDDKFRTVIDGQGKILDEIRALKAGRS